MPRLIDVNKQLVRLYRLHLFCEDTIKQFLISADTVDAEPVRHGHWELVRNPMMYQTSPYVQVCSECGTAFPYKMPYCGECGAKMDERREDETD